jgi:hypothetical protein
MNGASYPALNRQSPWLEGCAVQQNVFFLLLFSRLIELIREALFATFALYRSSVHDK